jgi:hypothetical protein
MVRGTGYGVRGRSCARYAGYASYAGSNPNKLAKPQNRKTAQLQNRKTI